MCNRSLILELTQIILDVLWQYIQIDLPLNKGTVFYCMGKPQINSLLLPRGSLLDATLTLPLLIPTTLY